MLKSQLLLVTLLAQTPFTEPDDPDTGTIESELRLAIVASNRGQARLGELDVSVTLGSSVLSRSEFDSVIAGGPVSPAHTTSVPFAGQLEPGTARTFEVRVDMAAVPSVSGDDSRVYPLVVALGSGGDPIAAMFSAAIHLVRVPEQPMRLAWWTELSTPIAFDAQGRPALKIRNFPMKPAVGGMPAMENMKSAMAAASTGERLANPA